MKKQIIFSFNEKLYKRCIKELNKKSIQQSILDYENFFNVGYKPDFLSLYYSPTLTALKQFFGDLKNKHILEVGFRLPLFLNYLKKQGAIAYGIDSKPRAIKKNLWRMSVENLNKTFLNENKNKFHAIIERITLSRLYDECHVLETGKPRFKNKRKIISNLYNLLKPRGILILQDDRGTIFTEAQFAKVGFKKLMKETPIIFKDNDGKYLGWNVLVAYRKAKGR